nr:hypothetical protein [Tanacetum cinerariifolium]
KMESVLKENDRLLKHALGVDIANIVVKDCMNVNCLTVDACEQCVTTESELKTDFIKKENYEMLLKQYHTLEKHCISLELNNQLNTEIFPRDNMSSSESAPTDDDKLYKLKEGNFKMLRIQDIEDMLLLLVQGKRVEDLQLGVKSYQKKLNLIKPDTYRSDLKRKEANTVYSSPRAKVDKPDKEKQPTKTSKAKGLTVLSEKSSEEDDDDDEVNMSKHDEDVNDQSDDNDQDDDDDNDQDDDDDDQNDDDYDDQDDNDDQIDDNDERTDSDNDGDDFIHPKFSTHDDEDKEEESFDPIVQTPSHDEDNDKDSHGMNVKGDEIDDEGANEDDDANKLHRDVNINLEGRDIQMADVQTTQLIEDSHVIVTPVNPEGIDSIFILHPPPTPIVPTLQQTLVPSPANDPSSSLQDLPNFRSLFGFDHRLKALEINFLEFMQSNQFAEAISLIRSIVDKYLDHRMNEAVKIIKEQVKEQVKAQVSKILPKIEKTINEQLEAEVLTRSSNSSKRSYVVAANLSEIELKKILIEKMETFVMNQLKVDTLTPELLAGPTYELIKGSCKSLVELKLFLEEVYKATTDQLDWNNLEEDLQLGVESYQKKINLTKPDTYRSNLKRKEAYTAYSNPRGFIYQNKDKQNRLIRIDELHKFSKDTLNDVQTAFDDRLKGIRMQYPPQTI